MKDKPKLHLLSGKKASDADALAKFYEQITGKKPTPEEIKKARKRLKAAKEQAAKK